MLETLLLGFFVSFILLVRQSYHACPSIKPKDHDFMTVANVVGRAIRERLDGSPQSDPRRGHRLQHAREELRGALEFDQDVDAPLHARDQRILKEA